MSGLRFAGPATAADHLIPFVQTTKDMIRSLKLIETVPILIGSKPR